MTVLVVRLAGCLHTSRLMTNSVEHSDRNFLVNLNHFLKIFLVNFLAILRSKTDHFDRSNSLIIKVAAYGELKIVYFVKFVGFLRVSGLPFVIFLVNLQVIFPSN